MYLKQNKFEAKKTKQVIHDLKKKKRRSLYHHKNKYKQAPLAQVYIMQSPAISEIMSSLNWAPVLEISCSTKPRIEIKKLIQKFMKSGGL